MRKTKKENRGITLIALIITIIVMLILVAVTISMAINGGLFEKAGQAVGDTKNAINKEQELGSGKITVGEETYNSIDEYIKDMDSIKGNDGEKFSQIYNKNTSITQEEGDKTYTAVIPQGFSMGISKGINKIKDGLVIRDAKGNEFVWIPVEVASTDTQTSIASFYRSDWTGTGRGTTKYTSTTGSSYNEPLTSGGYADEASDYNEMLKSVYENKGFYIGRYEAGTTSPRTDTANGTSEVVVKRDAYPYNYVGWGNTMSNYTNEITYSSKNQGLGALALSKGLYEEEFNKGNVGVKSTLCYGIQWDAMLDFIKDQRNVISSASWGNYINTPNTVTIRAGAKYTSSPTSTTAWTTVPEGGKAKTDLGSTILLTTGASNDFVAKNIYDVAGNVMEWTNEASSSSGRVVRGGDYDYNGSYVPASSRSSSNPGYCSYSIVFRPALYIK